jgi:peptidoglycan/xylan/chitin deacetylase (PgdA/CDA1 family)
MFRFTMYLVVFIALVFSSFFALVDYGPQEMVPIIMYNHIGEEVDTENINYTHSRRFQKHMKFLRDSGFNVISLEDVVNIYKRKEKVPRKTVAITFEHGYKDFYDIAFPILRKHHFPATVFVCSSYVDRGGYINREQLQRIADSNTVKIGSRGIHDNSLQGLQPQEQTLEIFNSKANLQKMAGIDVNFFSFPEGYSTKQLRYKVKESGYKGAVILQAGKKIPYRNRYAMRRNWVYTKDNYWSFRLKLWGNFPFIEPLWEKTRKFLNKLWRKR